MEGTTAKKEKRTFMNKDDLFKIYNAIVGTLIVVVGYFLVQTMNSITDTLNEHEAQIDALEKVQIQEGMTDKFILEKLEDIEETLKGE